MEIYTCKNHLSLRINQNCPCILQTVSNVNSNQDTYQSNDKEVLELYQIINITPILNYLFSIITWMCAKTLCK